MSNNRRPFTCYFCNELIKTETEMGHSTLCSKVLIPCPFKCGSYIQRADLAKHKAECNNNFRKSANLDVDKVPSNGTFNAYSLDRNGKTTLNHPKLQEEIVKLHKRFSSLETKVASLNQTQANASLNSATTASALGNIEDMRSTLKQHSLSIQKANYFNGFISEWKKNVDSQITALKSSLSSADTLKTESAKKWEFVQEKLIHLQNLQMDLSLLKQTLFKDSSHFRKTQMDFATNLEDIRATFNQQIASFENMWHQQTSVIQEAIRNISDVRQAIDEQKAKYAALVFELRTVSQISSEASQKIEIMERDFGKVQQELNQMKVNVEILEDLGSSDSSTYQRLVWRITEVESKLQKAKESDIVLKSPIFYTHRYGYKIRILLYINGLNKWKGRYALACIHVLKGKYDPLLAWPCIIEGQISLRDLTETSQKKDFIKFIKTKRPSGDEDEDEPQESSPTYIFIPHSVMLKANYTKNDTLFLDVNISENQTRHETSL
ncbi:TNF receptor-associated factor 5-like [Dendroctonus ponderosae]|uniref:TNF receptor-associated factor 5-like n=1 Tax=Dendroctonus ponderosae TaxID=77166 RepID=UPI002034D823|nr:TNF receptor-associated factor 5-like [Dendroctonus ponderosae]